MNLSDDLGVGTMKFPVTRAFQWDQTVLFGIEIHVKSYLSQECGVFKWFVIHQFLTENATYVHNQLRYQKMKCRLINVNLDNYNQLYHLMKTITCQICCPLKKVESRFGLIYYSILLTLEAVPSFNLRSPSNKRFLWWLVAHPGIGAVKSSRQWAWTNFSKSSSLVSWKKKREIVYSA